MSQNVTGEGYKYFITFAALPGVPGHAIVVWRIEGPRGEVIHREAHGFYPDPAGENEKVPLPLRKFIYLAGWPEPGATSDDLGRLRDATFKLDVRVGLQNYTRAKQVLERWRAKQTYSVPLNNCISFMQAVGDAIGLQMPMRETPYVIPERYVLQMIDSVMGLDTDIEAVPTFPPKWGLFGPNVEPSFTYSDKTLHVSPPPGPGSTDRLSEIKLRDYDAEPGRPTGIQWINDLPRALSPARYKLSTAEERAALLRQELRAMTEAERKKGEIKRKQEEDVRRIQQEERARRKREEEQRRQREEAEEARRRADEERRMEEQQREARRRAEAELQAAQARLRAQQQALANAASSRSPRTWGDGRPERYHTRRHISPRTPFVTIEEDGSAPVSFPVEVGDS